MSIAVTTGGTPVRISLAALVLLSCGLAPRSVAQDTIIVRGVVTDATGQPLPEVTVEALGTFISLQTDSLGRFQLDGLRLGAITLTARRLGYQPIQFIIDLDEVGTFQIPLGQIVLQPLAVGLTPVEVEAERVANRMSLAGFYERRKKNVGIYTTREEFMSQGNPQKPTDVLQRMRGIVALRIVRFRRTVPRAMRGNCPPLYYIDGRYMGNADAVQIDVVLTIDQIEGVEAYNSAAGMPTFFNRAGAMCGVIAFWTR